MSNILNIMDGYKEFMTTKSDPRTATWFLMSGPMPLVIILVSYLYFCVKVGPTYMKDRKPYDLKLVLLVYNALQVLCSIYLVYEGLMAGWLRHYSYKCQPVDYSDNPLALRMARAVWLYMCCKLIELLDTVFFVLRKKNNQVTFLHLYHHTMMPICAWIGVKFLPGGHGTLLGVINSFVHVIMYTYYLFSGLGPQYQKYLWWKKYLTTLQMVQFVIVFIHCAQLLFIDCNYPKGIIGLLVFNAAFFFYLFSTFFQKTYVKTDIKKVK